MSRVPGLPLLGMMLAAFPASAFAQSSCSASNEVGATCSITCSVGQAAICIPATGASMPECFCSGGDSGSQALRNLTLIGPSLYAIGAPRPPSAGLTIIDVRNVATSLVSAYGVVPVTRQLARKETRCRFRKVAGEWIESCWEVSVPYSETRSELLTLGQIDVIAAQDISIGQATRRDLPTEVSISAARVQNCQTAGAATATANVGVSVGRSSSISLTSSISRTSGRTIGISFPVPPITVQGSINVQESNSSASTKMDQNSTTITRSTTATVANLKPRSAVMIEVSSYKIGISIPFSVKVVVDAALSANDKGLKKLSDIATAEQRTFLVRGSLETNDASEANVVYYDIPFAPSACRGSSTSVEQGFSLPTEIRPREREVAR